MQRLIHHAYWHVPYYRELFDNAGIRPSDIRTLEDLPIIPVTHKRDMQPLRPEEVTSSGINLKSLIIRRSSGSTGEPFVMRRTWMEERLLQAFRRRAMYWLGQRPGDKVIRVARGRPTDPNDYQALLRAANAVGLYRAELVDCFLPFPEMIERIQRNRFDILTGLSSVLYHLAMHINQNGLKISPPRFITSGGEVLSPNMRREMERAFGARIYDIYGTHEFNFLAWQCKETEEYHICDDSVILEVVKDGRPAKPGEEGAVMATGLYSYSMPFIRYHTGDIVIRGSDRCGCGAPFSTIRHIQGRAIDYLVLPDGRKIHPYQIIRFFVHAERPWVRQYQLVQESMSRIVFKAVPLRKVEAEILEKHEKEVTGLLGEGVEFRIELAESIPREKSGKFKLFKSFLPPVDGFDIV
jgi:phenylacetate-CoA ligase